MKLEQIDTSTTAGKAEVMRLAAEGRKMAYKNKYTREWTAHLLPQHCDWDWPHADFAIIAEPVGPEEVWLLFGKGGALYSQISEKVRPRGSDYVRYVRAE